MSLRTSPWLSNLQWMIFSVATLVGVFFLVWNLLAWMDFHYPFWYDMLDIDQTIAEYGPQNQYRKQFEKTDKTEQTRLFSAIVLAIHNNGEGLATLQYRNHLGQPIDRLLRPPEIQHLQDVARLVAVFHRVGLIALLVALTLFYKLRKQRATMPSARRFLAWSGIILGLMTLIILAAGAKNLFYLLHTWVFPKDHQWFFYYQESLMTTMMQAPNLFAYIALAWFVLSFVLLLILFKIMRHFINTSV